MVFSIFFPVSAADMVAKHSHPLPHTLAHIPPSLTHARPHRRRRLSPSFSLACVVSALSLVRIAGALQHQLHHLLMLLVRSWTIKGAGRGAGLAFGEKPTRITEPGGCGIRRSWARSSECWRGALGLVAGGRRGVVLGPAVTRNLGGDEDEILGGGEREILGGEVGRQVSSKEILGARWAAARWVRRSRARGGRRHARRGEAGRKVGDDALGEV
uniref:Uncharacterized protein n=1 Tax=Aegilops tauschii TaxID=37682 RepID=M8C1S2_AEGTA